MTTTAVKSAATTRSDNAHAEPIKMEKRIGSTTYKVAVRFRATCAETLEDKLLRLIESEVKKGA